MVVEGREVVVYSVSLPEGQNVSDDDDGGEPTKYWDSPSSVACESGTILFAVTKCCLINHQSVSQSEADALSQVSNILHLFQANNRRSGSR